MNSEAVSALISKNPSLKAAKAKLEALAPGAYVMHQSWGFGQIKSYDDASQRLIIDFKGKKAHPMDPAFCVHTMDVLPANHLLVLKETESDKVAKLIADDPAQLIVDALQAYPNHATTAIDLEITLAQVLGEEKFKKWWSATKKLLAKDPRIAVPEKKTECYVLRDEPVSAESELFEQFNATRSARRRISIAEELIDAGKDGKTDLNSVLKGLSDAVKDSNQIDAAERLYGASVRDDLAKILGADVASLVPTQSELVSQARDLPAIAEKIPVHFQRHLLNLIRETHAIEYREILLTLLKSSQGKFTTEVINFLIEDGCSAELAATLTRWQTEQNLHAPVLLWIVKNRHSKKFAKLIHDLITPRLLGSIFFAIDYEALQSSSARRIPLADILSEDTELIPDLLATADAETARDLANALLLNQGFEELTKKSLLARFIKIFPSIQTLVAGDAESKDEQLIVSQESYDHKRKEYDDIITKKIPENSRAIASAREHGDLRENSEFKMAKQDQQVLMAQKAQLERELGRARITNFKDCAIDQVSVGSLVKLASDEGTEVEYAILGAWDSDPAKHIISYKTQLGLTMLSKKIGERISIKSAGGEDSFAIKSISRYTDSIR
jgi:transcription elongation GreA/GreB family factor